MKPDHIEQAGQLHRRYFRSSPHIREVDCMTGKPEIRDALNRIVDVVLAFRPKPKTKAAKQPKRRKIALEKKENPPEWRLFY
jgi:hypothetical protein